MFARQANPRYASGPFKIISGKMVPARRSAGGVCVATRHPEIFAYAADTAWMPCGPRATPCPQPSFYHTSVDRFFQRPAEHLTKSGTADDLRNILCMLSFATGVDFSHYRHDTLARGMARRMALQRIGNFGDYVRRLRETPDELTALFDEMLIPVTRFFREPGAFEALKEKVFPRIMPDTSGRNPVRVWVPGCSTGQEAYSIAICLLEYLEENGRSASLRIFGTDVSDSAIARARAGRYQEDTVAYVSPGRRDRFFVRAEGGWEISQAVRSLCVFARHDVTRDPSFSSVDLISCRNLLIYFGHDLHRQVLSMFHGALKSGGFLLLGASESIGEFPELFSAVVREHRIYARRPEISALGRIQKARRRRGA